MIDIDFEEDFIIEVFNSLGQRILHEIQKQNPVKPVLIPFQNIPSGIYLINIYTTEKYSYKIIKE